MSDMLLSSRDVTKRDKMIKRSDHPCPAWSRHDKLKHIGHSIVVISCRRPQPLPPVPTPPVTGFRV
jgi:hypothetical protein